MDGIQLSDFSIERILSPEFGRKKPRSLRQYFSLDSGSLRPPPPAPVGLLQYRVFGDTSYPCTAGFHHPDCSDVYLRFSNQPQPADGHQLVGYHGYQPGGFPAQSQVREKARMRTVFTDYQTKQLEALFELTDYPTMEVRFELARDTGLTEEIVRVWFKNHRARSKQQPSGSKVKSPSPPRGSEATRSSPPSSERHLQESQAS